MTKTDATRRLDPRYVIGAGVLAASMLAVGAAQGQDAEPFDQIQTRDGVRFACTGLGLDARQDPQWNQFAARIEAATQDGRYLGNVTYTIANTAGGTLLQVTCPGPWLMVDLDPGRYRATLDFEEHRREVDLQVTAQRQDVTVVHMPFREGGPRPAPGEG